MNDFEIIESSILLVNKCIENNNDSAYHNVADRYLPIGPQTLKDHKLDWNRINKVVIEDLFEISMVNQNKDTLRKEILTSLKSNRDTRELVDVIDELYLSSNAINSITPLSYLVTNEESISARTKTMVSIFKGLIVQPLKVKPHLNGNNPLESLLIQNIYLQCEKKPFDTNRNGYLPFLANVFSSDLMILCKSSSYFLNEIEKFLKIYSFIYLTQLTIHLCKPSNRFEKPSPKQLYFILETEKASRDRHECKEFGYDQIFSKTTGLAQSIFPILGYFNRISEMPSWDIIKNDDNNFLCKVNEFNKLLAYLFGEEYNDVSSLKEALNKGASFQKQIFEETLRNSKKSSRKTANNKVIDIFEKIFSAGFITDRKAAGKYFVLNSTNLMLMTNLVIGSSGEDKLLIDDVIDGFKQRGIWLDIKSKKALLKFYENVGNIEKLSDSGDAVYVKTTI
ncbi:DNA phosphorothioation-dependent restriction protein DptG [Aliivibrio fischeri]|uniref:DNA phosphorothioation-dependent restriction protein DptG n=1 Tax=Aliivibrio fischeri TaxID=668 RepID=UPI0007C576E7|nr:DNA phosphorothioation-dependent restriction protein DptG [Aliivibrio fischeri]